MEGVARRHPIPRDLALGGLVFLFAAGGCIPAGLLIGGAAATLVMREGFVDEDTYGGVVRTTAGKAFTSSIDVMDELCHKISVDRAFRTVSGTWKSSDVTVSVADAGDGEISVRVKTRKYSLLADQETAMTVFQRIMTRIKQDQTAQF